MGSYLLVLIVAAAGSALFGPVTAAIATRLGATDETRQPPIPRSGGLAIALGALASLILVAIVFEPTGLTLRAVGRNLSVVMGGATALLVVGLVDDVQPLRASTKFGAQVAVAVIVWALGVRVELLSAPAGAAELSGVVSATVTTLWLVGIANAFNLLDGADGVAGGSAFFASTAIFLVSVALGRPAVGLATAGLAGAILGFLPFNFPPARMFLGDSGSLFIGFLLAGLAVEGSMKGPTALAIAIPIAAFGVPVLDTTITLVRRIMRGRPVFEPDSDHLHHRLARSGLSPRQVVAVIYLTSAAFALAAMMFVNRDARVYAVGFVVVGAGVWLAVRRLQLHELNELARLARRGVLQPRTIAVNLELRRAAERLSRASSMDDLLGALAVLFRRSEFDHVLMLAGPKGERRGKSRMWRLEDGTFVPGWSQSSADEWEIVCPFDGGAWFGELHLRRRLGRRTLIVDLNLVLEVVQPTLTETARRISSPLAQ
jgi:UDP-GlcNAc:undecaprenyl-phosphate GlcNAc-1-phosphate transferase